MYAISKYKKQIIASCIHLFVLVVSLFIWGIFFPANMSPDSIDQYGQASTNEYHDWHPPIMALILAVVMKCGGDIGTCMLIQCLAGSFGVYYLARCIAGLTIQNDCLAQYIAVIVFLLLLLPISPLAFYLMTFWKDAWCAIAFLWIFAIAIILYKRVSSLTTSQFFFLYLGLIILIALAILARYNALLTVPLFIALLWFIIYRRISSHRIAIFLSLLPIVLYGGMICVQYTFFNITKRHPEQQIMALDLVGMIVLKPSLHHEFPYTSQNLQENYQDDYRYGDVGPLYWVTPLIIDESYTYNEKMVQEYRRAIVHFPLVWSKVKLRAFYELIRPTITHYWFHSIIVSNQFGLAPNLLFQKIREKFIQIAQRIVTNRWLRLFSGVHLLWISVNIIGCVVVLFLYLKYRNPDLIFWGIVLGIPFIYYCSYLLATPARDFRFMYPSTLSIQILSLSKFLGAVVMARKTVYQRTD